jgi:ATP-dependent DNA helicase RecQ
MSRESKAIDPREVLRRHWGYAAFRPRQEEIIACALRGEDALALLPTGGGKSLCYQVPALCMGRLCIVVSPLIALMKDQVEGLRERGIAAKAITAGMKRAEVENTLEAAALGKLSFLYVSPERLGTDLFQGHLPRMPLGLIAVDEAHCISQWGYDFRPAYLRIAELRARVPSVPVLALTASATPEVARDIMDRLAFRRPRLVRGSFARPELVLWVSHGEDRMGRLLKILRALPGTAIVYARDRKGTVRIAQLLAQQGISAAAYHAGLRADERDRIQRDWTAGATRVVAATNAFGMGIDKADVRCVIHLEPPPDLESYYQEAGRGGRDGRTAHAFLLTGPGDRQRAEERLRLSFPALEEVRRVYQALADMHGIALGSGLLEAYAIDIAALAQRAALRPPVVAHALKALELGGYLALSDGARSPSRVLITADAASVHRLRIGDQRHGPLLEALLRMHGGLYEEPSLIDEARIARHIGKDAAEVIKQLQALERMGILSYQPRSDAPTATLLVPRADADRLQLDPAALKDRQRRATERLKAMLHYVEAIGTCRMRMLLDYFGEPLAADCGRCDACTRKSAAQAYGTLHEAAPLAEEPLADYERDIEHERLRRDEYGASEA